MSELDELASRVEAARVEVLREANGKWMARQEVRARARDQGVGDTGLLDHVLKTISDAKVTLSKVDKNNNPKGKKCHASTARASRLDRVFLPIFDGRRRLARGNDDD